MAVQRDGRLLIVAVTEYDREPVVLRLTRGGRRDWTFARGGILHIPGIGDSAIALTEDEQILVTGRRSTGAALAPTISRYTSDGEVDPTFGQEGVAVLDLGTVDGSFEEIVPLPDGSVAAAGAAQPAFGDDNALVARFTGTGEVDSSFSDDGWHSFDADASAGGYDRATDIAAGADGGITVAAELDGLSTDAGALRFHPDGTLDTSFSDDGVAFVDLGGDERARSVALDAGRKVLLGGAAGSGRDLLVARLGSDGELDASFSGDGIQKTDLRGDVEVGEELLVQPDGRVILGARGGPRADFVLTRYMPDGALDRSFSGDGVVMTDFSFAGTADYLLAAELDDRGRLIAVGNTSAELDRGGTERESVAVARYLLRGSAADRDADADGLRDERDRCLDRFGPRPLGCPIFRPRVTIGYKATIDDFVGHVEVRRAWPCGVDARVQVFRIRRGQNELIGQSRSKDHNNGVWQLSALARHGRYYARTRARLKPRVGYCAPGRSDVLVLGREPRPIADRDDGVGR